MAAGWAITGTGPQQLDKLRTRLGSVAQSSGGKSVTATINRKLAPVVRNVVRDVQRSAMATPSGKSGRSTGLRTRIANSVLYKIETNGHELTVRIYSDPGKMPAGEQHLPAMLEGTIPWHHPTFGHRPSVAQGSSPWFHSSTQRSAASFRKGMNDAIAEVKHYLATGS